MLETLYVMTPGISIRQDGGLLVLERMTLLLKRFLWQRYQTLC